MIRARSLGRGAIAAVLMLCATAACDRLPGRPQPPGSDTVRDFATLYGQHCAGCHGADGRLGAARPLADPLYLAWIDDTELRRVVAEGVPDSLMPGFARSAGGTLEPEQVESLVSSIRQRWSGEPPRGPLPPYAAGRAGDAGRGERVFATRCAACHGSDGRGGPHAGSVVDPAYLALVSDQALRSTIVAGRLDLGMPDFRGREGQSALSDADVRDVVAWLAAHRAPPAVASLDRRSRGEP